MYSDDEGRSGGAQFSELSRVKSAAVKPVRVKSALVHMLLLLLAPVGLAFSQISGKTATGSGQHAVSAAYSLSVRPDTCAALHKGQRCFTQVVLSWSVPDRQQYCVFIEADKTPLHCSTATHVRYTIDYASATSTVFELRQGTDGQAVASAIVSAAWVYRTGRRSSSSWRLF